MTIRVVMAGATGWVGKALIPAIMAADGLELAGAVARSAAGKDSGEVIGHEVNGVLVAGTLEEALETSSDVVIDYTKPNAVKRHALLSIEKGRHVVVGTSGSRGTWYRGTIRLVRENNTLFDVRNHVPLEEYLRGVVPRESPAYWEMDALKAQAVAARSYVLAEIAGNSAGLTCDTTACQVYGGRAAVDRDGNVVEAREHQRTDQAVSDTRGEVRTYNGAVAFTQFSATNGGWSTDGGRPYLVALLTRGRRCVRLEQFAQVAQEEGRT